MAIRLQITGHFAGWLSHPVIMMIISPIMVRPRHLPGVWLLRRQIAGLYTVMMITAGRKEGWLHQSPAPKSIRKHKGLLDLLQCSLGFYLLRI